MSSPAFEAFLARLYTDEALLAEFLKSPEQAARAAGLDDPLVAALLGVDRDALVMAARSFRAKREAQSRSAPTGRLARLWSGVKRRPGKAPRY